MGNSQPEQSRKLKNWLLKQTRTKSFQLFCWWSSKSYDQYSTSYKFWKANLALKTSEFFTEFTQAVKFGTIVQKNELHKIFDYFSRAVIPLTRLK